MLQPNKPVFASTENAFSPLDLSPGLWVDASDVTTITGSTSTVSNGEIRVETTDTLTKPLQVIDQPTNGMHKMDYLWLALMDPMTTWTVLDLEHLVQYLHSLSLIVIPRLLMDTISLGWCFWSGTKLHLATDSNGLNSKMALNGGVNCWLQYKNFKRLVD